MGVTTLSYDENIHVMLPIPFPAKIPPYKKHYAEYTRNAQSYKNIPYLLDYIHVAELHVFAVCFYHLLREITEKCVVLFNND